MATPLPPSTMGTGALYAPHQSSSTDQHQRYPQPRTSPIAHFASLPNDGVGNETLLKASGSAEAGGIPTSGRLLAVNSRYVAYAVKKGLVRVIDRRSAARALLRGHDERTRMVDASFFGESGAKEGIGGLWDDLAELREKKNGINGTNNNGGGSNHNNVNGDRRKKTPLPPAAASDVLATLGGAGDQASILIWRLHSSNNNNVTGGAGVLGADKLLEVRFGEASRLVWHPFNPNRFLLLHRNMNNGNGDNEAAQGGRTVATLVETTRLVTRPHETESHMVCDCEERDPTGAPAGGLPGGSPMAGVPGMIPLKVTAEDAEEGDNLTVAGANDLAWSNRDARHVLTGHDDGKVRLWDLTSTRTSTAGGAEGAGGGELPSFFIRCLAQLDVTSTAASPVQSRCVTRVLFLSQYEDSTNSKNSITPPFLTGTDANRTITLWSSFSSGSAPADIRMPRRLRVFGMHGDHNPTSRFPLASSLSVELIPAPYRPEPPAASSLPSMEASAADVSAWVNASGGVKGEETVPSSFVLLAERNAGTMHALHLDTEWKEAKYDGGDEAAATSRAVTVKGFDYVTTLNVVHPIYSYALAPASNEPGETINLGAGVLEEERDVDLCCIQSKAVQMLTLSADMLCAPNGDMGGELASGVTLLESPVTCASDDKEGEGEEFAEEEFEEEYDMEEDGLLGDVGSSANDSGDDEGDDDTQEEDAVPAATESEPNAFSNWLGAIANPLPPPASTAGKKPKSSPPPGLGFTSILPPPPGMAPAPAVSAPLPAVNNPMNFLSPMQILSGSGSDLDTLQKEEPLKSTSPVPTPARPSVSAPPPGMPVASNKGSKKPPKKNKSQVKGRALSPKQPPVVGPMKILQRAEEPHKEEEARSSILPPHPAEPSPAATLAADVVASSPSVEGDAAVDATKSHVASSAADLAAIETAIENAIAAHAKSREAELLVSIRKAIASEIASTVGLAVGNAVRAGFKDANGRDRQANDARQSKVVEQAVQKGVSAGLAGGLAGGVEEGMDRALGKALGGEGNKQGKLAKSLERHAKESAERAAKEAVAGMKPAIMNSLHQTMREVVVPAYESATRQMFEQTSSTLEQGLAQISLNQANNAANASSSMAPTLQAMSAQMMKMSESIQSLNMEVVQLRSAVNSVSVQNQNASAQQPGGAPAGPPRPVGIRDEVTALCHSRRYEEAFTKAVSASDGDLVLFACKNADAGAVFNSNGEGVISISQPILICLMQQLGAVLISAEDAGDVRVILNWLQEIAVTIDPTNVNIQRHVGSVVQQLLANINSKMSSCDPAFRRPLQMLIQILRGLL